MLCATSAPRMRARSDLPGQREYRRRPTLQTADSIPMLENALCWCAKFSPRNLGIEITESYTAAQQVATQHHPPPSAEWPLRRDRRLRYRLLEPGLSARSLGRRHQDRQGLHQGHWNRCRHSFHPVRRFLPWPRRSSCGLSWKASKHAPRPTTSPQSNQQIHAQGWLFGRPGSRPPVPPDAR